MKKGKVMFSHSRLLTRLLTHNTYEENGVGKTNKTCMAATASLEPTSGERHNCSMHDQ